MLYEGTSNGSPLHLFMSLVYTRLIVDYVKHKHSVLPQYRVKLLGLY